MPPVTAAPTAALTREQVAHYHEHGWLRIPEVFTPAEAGELADHLDSLISVWADTSPGWSGPWRKVYMVGL